MTQVFYKDKCGKISLFRLYKALKKCNGYFHGYFFRGPQKTQEKQGFLNGGRSSCKTVIHQFKSGRHLQRFPITKVVGNRCFSPFQGEKQAFLRRFFVEVSQGAYSQKSGFCTPQVPSNPLKSHINHEKWIFSWIFAGVFLTP